MLYRKKIFFLFPEIGITRTLFLHRKQLMYNIQVKLQINREQKSFGSTFEIILVKYIICI